MDTKGRWWLTLAAFVLTACSSGNPATTIVVEIKDTGYTPALVEVPAGEAVKLTLRNTDTQEHQWGIQKIGLMTSGDGMSGMAGMSGTMDDRLNNYNYISWLLLAHRLHSNLPPPSQTTMPSSVLCPVTRSAAR